MSLFVHVSYEPDGSPSISIKDRNLQLKVSRLQSGSDLCKKVYEHAKCELKGTFEDYSLYWPDRKIWIHHDQQLGLAKIEAGAKLYYRPKKTHLKIRFLDASSTLFYTDETQSVRGVVADLCRQLRLEHPEELSLVVAGDYAVQKHHPAKKTLTRVSSSSPTHNRRSTLTRPKPDSKSASSLKTVVKDSQTPPLSPRLRRRRPSLTGSTKKHSLNWSGTRVKKQISKKHQIRLDTPWLDPSKTLAEQEVTESDELILMYRFYYHMELSRDSPNIEMLYKQARATYLAGELLCSTNDMVQLSAILCQITKGDYSKHKYAPEFLSSIKNAIAPPKCKLKGIAKQIMAAHRLLEGLSETDAMCMFIKLWSSLDLFGVEFLSCTNLDTKDKGLIGVSKSRIMFLFHKKKKSLIWDIDSLMHWDHDVKKDTVSLTLTHDGTTDVLNLHIQDYSGVLADCLKGHRELSDTIPDISRTYMEFQFSEELESAIREFAPSTMRGAKDQKILSSLTYEKVFWAGKIENPMLSEEELSQLEKESWENPVFDNMDQLMEERFKFLDFNEYIDDAGEEVDDVEPSDDAPVHSDSSSHESLPIQQPAGPDRHTTIPVISYTRPTSNASPLLQSQRTNSESFLAYPQDYTPSSSMGLSRALSSSHSGSVCLTNGLSPKDYHKRISGHHRSRSNGSSSGDSDITHAPSLKKKDAGPLSSSSLPPDGMRMLVAGAKRKTSKDEPITLSYRETA